MEQKREQPEQTKEYLIGDFARMIGVSRDALRFYEKKGVVEPHKKENGYRYYSEEDFYRLMSVIYHRKMNSSLEEIEELLNGDGEVERMQRHLEARLAEEEEAIRRHQLARERILLMKRDFGQVENCLDICSVQTMPEAYLMERCRDLPHALKQWFVLASAANGLDMTYFYTVLRLEEGRLSVQYTDLLLYKRMAERAGIDVSGYPLQEERECIYMVIRSRDPLASVEAAERMEAWGRERGLRTEGLLCSNNMTTAWANGENIYWIELYMPLAKESGQPLSR